MGRRVALVRASIELPAADSGTELMFNTCSSVGGVGEFVIGKIKEPEDKLEDFTARSP